jgi:hypothetical protein
MLTFDYQGVQLPEQDWNQANNQGLAGALAGMSAVSGDKWNGVADWLSRAAAGFAGAKNSYLSDALQTQQREATLAEAQRRTDADIAAQQDRIRHQQEADALTAQTVTAMKDWAAKNGVQLPPDRQLWEDAYREHIRQAKEDQDAKDLAAWAVKNHPGLDLTGIPANAVPGAIQRWETQHNPPSAAEQARINLENAQLANLSADNKRADQRFLYEQLAKDAEDQYKAQAAPFYDKGSKSVLAERSFGKDATATTPAIDHAPIVNSAGSFHSSGAFMAPAPLPPDRSMLLQQAGLIAPEAPASPPPPPPAAVRAEARDRAESQGLVPRVSSDTKNAPAAKSAASVSAVSNGPAPKVTSAPNPQRATDSDLVGMVTKLGVPPDRVAQLPPELASKVRVAWAQAKTPEQQAQVLAALKTALLQKGYIPLAPPVAMAGPEMP